MTTRGLLLIAAFVIVVTAVAFALLLPTWCYFSETPIAVPGLGAECEGLRSDNQMALRVGVVGVGLAVGLILAAFAVREPSRR